MNPIDSPDTPSFECHSRNHVRDNNDTFPHKAMGKTEPALDAWRQRAIALAADAFLIHAKCFEDPQRGAGQDLRRARMAIMALLVELGGFTPSEVRRAFAVDLSTVKHAVARLAPLEAADVRYGARVHAVRAGLKAWREGLSADGGHHDT